METSQCITEVILFSLGAAAASQGTMNNLSFGDQNFQYYETIAGGAGAGPGFAGASAVQSHMTNSRLTDPEVLEIRFPVLIETFKIRKGSGGGDGLEGRNLLISRNGSEYELPYTCRAQVEEGDVLLIETPGGGGYGG